MKVILKYISTQYSDNWIRTFQGVPDFTPNELKMLKEWVAKNDLVKVVLYLTNERFEKCLDTDTVEFVIREILKGNL